MLGCKGGIQNEDLSYKVLIGFSDAHIHHRSKLIFQELVKRGQMTIETDRNGKKHVTTEMSVFSHAGEIRRTLMGDIFSAIKMIKELDFFQSDKKKILGENAKKLFMV